MKFKTPAEARIEVMNNPFLTREWREMLYSVIREWEEQEIERKEKAKG